MPVSKFTRIITEGDTTDGRVVQRSWLEQIAKNFNRSTYGARVWLEHFRSTLPDSPFKAYGDVLAVKTEEVTINGEKKLALLAQIDATSDLVAMNKARQKIYTSAEIDPNFAKSGEAYLVGLAVTDSPASLGTEMLQFASGAQTNPLAARKQNQENLFTAAQEAEIEFDAEMQTVSPGDSLFGKVKELLGIKGKTDEARFTDIGQAVEAVAQSQKGLLESFNAQATALQIATDQLKVLTTSLEKDRADFAAFKKQIEGQPDDTTQRPAATGATPGSAAATDC